MSAATATTRGEHFVRWRNVPLTVPLSPCRVSERNKWARSSVQGRTSVRLSANGPVSNPVFVWTGSVCDCMPVGMLSFILFFFLTFARFVSAIFASVFFFFNLISTVLVLAGVYRVIILCMCHFLASSASSDT